MKQQEYQRDAKNKPKSVSIITLIGMPGVGKSSIGKKLAKELGCSFIDTDKLIEKNTGLKLQTIIDKRGEKEFLIIEEKTILNLGNLHNSVISPGGSVIYSEKAMKFLKKISRIVFLYSTFEDIQKRLKNTETRGIVGLKNKDFKALFDERIHLYKRYADITIEIPKIFDSNKIVAEIINKIRE